MPFPASRAQGRAPAAPATQRNPRLPGSQTALARWAAGLNSDISYVRLGSRPRPGVPSEFHFDLAAKRAFHLAAEFAEGRILRGRNLQFAELHGRLDHQLASATLV